MPASVWQALDRLLLTGLALDPDERFPTRRVWLDAFEEVNRRLRDPVALTPVEALFLTEFPPIGDLPYFLTLNGYAFYVFRLQQSPSSLTARVAQETFASVGETPALFMGVAWDTLLDGNVRTLIERDLLVGFLQRQRWFGGKARAVRTAR